MTQLLQINSSVFGDGGQSSRLADEFVARWRSAEPGLRVTRRALADEPLLHLTDARFKAALTPAAERSADQQREAEPADAAVQELIEADALVLGVPVYNFQVPSTLKAWFDHVARAGTTFRYTENGPRGLLEGKRAFVFVTSGGRYSGTDADFAAPYVKHFLAFLGIEDVTIIRAEGLAMGEEHARSALDEASERIARLAA